MSGISIKVDWDPGALRPGVFRRGVAAALRKAGQTALRDMRSEASKRVRARKAIRAQFVRRALTMRAAKGSDIERMEWVLRVSGDPVPLSAYPFRQRTRSTWIKPKDGGRRIRGARQGAGISVQVNRGTRTVLPQAFAATLQSGHKGIFERRGAKRLPIDERFGSRVSDALRHAGESEGVLARGRRSFGDTYTRMLPLELAKLEK